MSVEIVRDLRGLHSSIARYRNGPLNTAASLAIVPTMGAIHEAHEKLIIEAKTPELAKKIIIYEFNHSKKLLTNIPRGWYGNILKKNLVIDEVKLIWEY